MGPNITTSVTRYDHRQISNPSWSLRWVGVIGEMRSRVRMSILQEGGGMDAQQQRLHKHTPYSSECNNQANVEMQKVKVVVSDCVGECACNVKSLLTA